MKINLYMVLIITACTELCTPKDSLYLLRNISANEIKTTFYYIQTAVSGYSVCDFIKDISILIKKALNIKKIKSVNQ